MGFRKTEKGNVIYDFDFVPAKLVPLTSEEAHGASDHYVIEDAIGNRAPIEFEFQGERYANYGFAFASVKNGAAGEGVGTCVFANAMVIATLASLFAKSEGNEEEFDAWDATGFASRGITFPVMGKEEALEYLKKSGIPRDGFKTLKEQI